MTYLALLLAHLLAALFFIGTVFFEVLMLSPIARRVPQPAMRAVEQELRRDCMHRTCILILRH